jgi:Predicted P-loop-containing kinase
MAAPSSSPELVIITGLSGSGKGTVLKTLEDHGYYAVDNLPLDLIETFAELTRDSPNIRRAALVVDIREREQLQRLPAIIGSCARSCGPASCFSTPTTTRWCGATARRGARTLSAATAASFAACNWSAASLPASARWPITCSTRAS